MSHNTLPQHRALSGVTCRRFGVAATIGLLSLLSWVAAAGPTPPDAIPIRPLDKAEARTVSYRRQIQPLLADRCGQCHGGAVPSGGLSVTSLAMLQKGGAHGASIVAGQPDASLLIQYVRGLKTPKMPMSGPALSVDDVHLFREWILAGAKDDPNATGGLPAKASLNPADRLPIEDESGLSLADLRVKHLARLPKPPAVPVLSAPSFNPIDRFVAAKWREHKFPIPPVCDDGAFVRRAYLDVVGVIPTTEQALAFVADKTPDKRTRLVDTLLARDDDYAANWIPFWEDALASNGTHQGGAESRPNLRPWLMENLRRNRPYDEMVAELIDPTSTGPTAPLARGWIMNSDHVQTAQSAAYVAQVFMGTAVKCASCHNHFLNPEWTQRKFMGYASYFTPQNMEVIRCEVHEGEFVPPTFLFNQPGARNAAAHTPLDLDHRLKQVSRLIVDPENPRFATCIVNRLWKRYFGLGLVEPADDFRVEGNAPSHPELLAWLADDFMRHGYDLKHTIRLMLTSRTYQLRYDPRLADTYSASNPDRPRFYRSPALRRLTEEQLLDSINVALGNTNVPRAYLDNDSTALTRALGKPASRNEISTARPDDVAVVQALELLNGDEFSRRVALGTLDQELSQEPEWPRIVTRAYWAALGRPPTRKELGSGNQFLEAAPPTPGVGRPTEAVWWEDGPPAGAMLTGPWQMTQDLVYSGKQAHTAPTAMGAQQHLFLGAATPLQIGLGDTLFTYAYLDPKAMPRELMFQWNDGSWEHRAFWGEDLIPYGTPGTGSRRRMGDLPPPGRWVRLEVPAEAVGLTGHEIGGLSFDQFDGHVTFDRSGVVHAIPPHPTVVDLLWALTVSPEFQYIR